MPRGSDAQGAKQGVRLCRVGVQGRSPFRFRKRPIGTPRRGLSTKAGTIGRVTHKSGGGMEGEKTKRAVPGDLARVSCPDESRRRFFRLEGLGTLGLAAASSRARAAAAEPTSPPVPPGTGRAEQARALHAACDRPGQGRTQFPFGAVIVQRATGVIVAEGHNRSAESPTFHGEIVVINHCAADTRRLIGRRWISTPPLNPVPCVGAPSSGQASPPSTTGRLSLICQSWGGSKSTSVRGKSRGEHPSEKASAVLAEERNALFEAAPKNEYKR